MNVDRHVVVRGRVQGVGYRAFVADQARRLGIEGWVRNRRDGTVEVVVCGNADVIAEMIEACRKGPWGAKVDGLAERDAASDERALRRSGEPFSVLPTV